MSPYLSYYCVLQSQYITLADTHIFSLGNLAFEIIIPACHFKVRVLKPPFSFAVSTIYRATTVLKELISATFSLVQGAGTMSFLISIFT